MQITFTVPGVPIPQPRPRATLAPGGRSARIHEVTHIKNAVTGERRPHPIAAFKATVRLAAEAVYKGAPLSGPLGISCRFIFPRPKSMLWAKRPMPRVVKTGRPDWDNLGKSVCDALNGLLWIDDGQIAAAFVTKYTAAGDEQPRTEIMIETIDVVPPSTMTTVTLEPLFRN